MALQLGFGFLTCSGGCSITTSCSFISLALWLRWLQGLLCLYRLLDLTHFGRSWMKSVGRWLPLRDIVSGDKGVGWLALQIKFGPLIACAVEGVSWKKSPAVVLAFTRLGCVSPESWWPWGELPKDLCHLPSFSCCFPDPSGAFQ